MTEDSRRKHERHTVHWPCRLLMSDKTIVAAQVKNVSFGGVGIEVPQMIPVGQSLSIEMRPMVAGRSFLIRAKVEVSFSMILSGGSGYSKGLRFTLIPEEHDKALQEIVKILASRN